MIPHPGARLRAERIRRKITQAAAAKRIGMHQPDWCDAENGKPQSLDRWLQMAQAIGADPFVIDSRLCPVGKGEPIVLTLTPQGMRLVGYYDRERVESLSARFVEMDVVTMDVLLRIVEAGHTVIVSKLDQLEGK